MDTVEADGEGLDLFDGSEFDAVISRVGLIYFPDQHSALLGMRQALREGGRVSAIVYSTADRNEFFSLPVSIIRRAKPDGAATGPARTVQPRRPGVLLQAALGKAGFTDVSVDAVPAPLVLDSAAQCVQFEQESFSALHQMLVGVAEEERQDVWDEIHRQLSRFEGPD